MEDQRSDRSLPVITAFAWDPFSSGGLEPDAQTKFEIWEVSDSVLSSPSFCQWLFELGKVVYDLCVVLCLSI